MKTLDFHCHLGNSRFGWGQNLDRLLQALERHQIEHALLCPVKPVDYHYGPENQRVAKAVQEFPERLSGLLRVDPRHPHALRDLRLGMEELGLRGLFLHPWEDLCPVNLPEVCALMEALAEYDRPVMIAGGHVRVSMPSQIADLARRYPQQKMVITSGGQINISGIMLNEATQLLREHSNLFLETSGIYREDFIEDLVPIIGSERMLFGSNAPEYELGLEVLRPRLAHLDDEHKANLCWNTGAKLLGLDRER